MFHTNVFDTNDLKSYIPRPSIGCSHLHHVGNIPMNGNVLKYMYQHGAYAYLNIEHSNESC